MRKRPKLVPDFWVFHDFYLMSKVRQEEERSFPELSVAAGSAFGIS
jgi:hypothetical protein